MTDHEVDVLAFPGADELRAAGAVAPPAPASLHAALEAVRAAAVGDGPMVTLTTAPRPLRRGRRILASALAVAAIAAGVAVYPTLGIGDRQPASVADAADFLHGVADTVGSTSVPDAKYWKVSERFTMSFGKVKPKGQNRITTQWLSRNEIRTRNGDGPVTNSITPQGTMVNGKNGHRAILWAAPPFLADYPSKNRQTSWHIGRNTVAWDDIKTLPTQPAALRAWLVGDATGVAAEQGVFRGIEALLAKSPAGPRLRAALYDVLAGIPHVRLVGHVKDSMGRQGTAVQMDMKLFNARLIIDPRTGRMLESTSANPGGLLSRATYLSAGPTEDAPPLTTVVAGSSGTPTPRPTASR